MMAGIGIIAASASAASTTARGGDSFAAGTWIGRVFRLRQKPGRIELGRMRLRRGGGLLGRLILCARFRGITRRRIVFRRLWRRACLRGFRVLLLGRRRFEHGSEKLFAGDQRGNEERPGQETERAGSLVRTLHPGFEDLLLLFEQFAFFYFFHDRCLSSRSTEKQFSPGSIHCRASLFGASGVMHHVVRRVRRHVEMPYVEVIRRAHLADGVIERMVGRHRSERAVQVTRMIRTVRAIITVGEVELGQRFTRVVLAAVVVLGMLRMVVVLGMLRMVVVLGMLRMVVVLGMLRMVVVLGMLRVVVVLGMLRMVVVLGMLRMVVVPGMLRVVVVLGMLRVVVVLGVLLVVVLGLLRVVVVLGLLLVIVVLPFLATLVLVVAAVVGLGWLAFLAWDAEILYRLENACNAAQDRHGFAPRLGLATVAGTCLVRITTPSPLLSPTHADGCSGEK